MKTIVDNLIECLENNKQYSEKTNLSPKTYRELCEIMTPKNTVQSNPIQNNQLIKEPKQTKQPIVENIPKPAEAAKQVIAPIDNDIISEGNPNAKIFIIIEKPLNSSAFQFHLSESPDDLLTKIIEKGMKFKREELFVIKIPDTTKCYNKTQELIKKHNPKSLLLFGPRPLRILLKKTPPLKNHLGKFYEFENILAVTVHNLASLVRDQNKEKSITWGIIQELLKRI